MVLQIIYPDAYKTTYDAQKMLPLLHIPTNNLIRGIIAVIKFMNYINLDISNLSIFLMQYMAITLYIYYFLWILIYYYYYL